MMMMDGMVRVLTVRERERKRGRGSVKEAKKKES